MAKRLVEILGGYVAASLAASLAIVMCLQADYLSLFPQGRKFSGPLSVWGDTPLWLLAAGDIACFALVPTSIVIGIGETARLRSARFYGSSGAIVAVGTGAVLALWLLREDWLLALPHLVLAGVAGLVSGLVYWRLAGRSAGAWRIPRESETTALPQSPGQTR